MNANLAFAIINIATLVVIYFITKEATYTARYRQRHETLHKLGYPPIHCDTDGDLAQEFYDDPESFGVRTVGDHEHYDPLEKDQATRAQADAWFAVVGALHEAYGNKGWLQFARTGMESAVLAIRRLAKKPAGVIELTPAEIQSGLDRVRFAEGLIRQLPEDHDGRNTWLLNYGRPTPTEQPSPKQQDDLGLPPIFAEVHLKAGDMAMVHGIPVQLAADTLVLTHPGNVKLLEPVLKNHQS